LRSVKRSSILFLLLLAVAGTSAVREVDRAWRRMESSQTGAAKWIWATDDVHSPHPVRFTATRSILIEEPITFARAKIFVDRRYRFFLDGAPVGEGGQKPGDPMDVYDLSTRFPRGPHVFAIEAESPTGIGGILFGLDISGHGRNAVVSDEKWKIGDRPAFVWGKPPIYPWLFPSVASMESASRAAAQ
jgi:hypothetical protein